MLKSVEPPLIKRSGSPQNCPWTFNLFVVIPESKHNATRFHICYQNEYILHNPKFTLRDISMRNSILEFSVPRIKSNEHSVNRGLFFFVGSFPPAPNTIMSPKLEVRNLRGLESSFIIVIEITIRSQSFCLQNNPPCALLHSTSVTAIQVLDLNTSSLVYSHLFFSTFLASSLTFEELLGDLLSLGLLSQFLPFDPSVKLQGGAYHTLCQG